MKIQIKTNERKFTRKPTALEVAQIAKKFRIRSCTVNELRKIICSGQSVKPAIVDSNGRFISQQVFFIDVDNTENFYSVDYNIMRCKLFGLVPILVYPTFSFCSQNQKHRLVFVLNEPVKDLRTRNLIQKYLNNIFGGDSKTADVNRLFFGSNGKPFFSSECEINKDEILKKVEAVQYEFII